MGRDKAKLLDTIEPILENHLVDDLSADYTSPPIKELAISIKFFKDHHPVTPMAPHNTSLPDGMTSRTDLPPRRLPQVLPVLQHSMGSSLHDLDFTGKRGRVNKVNPVFFREKYCILWGGNTEFLGGARKGLLLQGCHRFPWVVPLSFILLNLTRLTSDLAVLSGVG